MTGVSESQQKVISGWVMCRKINGKPPDGGRRPDWADDGYFFCSLLNRDVLLGASVAAPEGAEEKIAAFFYYVPADDGGVNLGVRFLCTWLTLYVVISGVPPSFSQVKQVCLPIGETFDTAESGEGGAVMWSDMTFQRILRYDRMKPDNGDAHLLRYARYVSYLAKPSFAGMGAGGDAGGMLNAQRPTPAAQVERGDAGLGPQDEEGGGPEFHGDFSLVVCGGRRIDLSKKFKARAFLRFLHGSLKGAPDKTFYVEEMRDKFNAQFGAGRHRGKWVSERFREDLFKGLGRKDFDLLFETVDGGAGVYRLRF